MWSFTIGISRRTVIGALFLGVAAAISSLGIVRAERDDVTRDANQVYKCSSGSACVAGEASGRNVFGVWGKSSGGTGVQGNSTATNKNSGVSGVNTATTGTGYGVYGRSSNGPGLYGVSVTSNGVEGHASAPGPFNGGSPNAGVAGFWEPCGTCYARSAAGVYGFASGYTSGGYGYGKGTYGVYAESAAGNNEGSALIAKSDGSADIFQGFGNGTDSHCFIDSSANLTCTGKIAGGAQLSTRHRLDNGQHVLAYASESATATIEDVGTARLVGGVANVQIDPTFAETTDHKWYYVFLTPLGDTRGLYVSMKTASEFQVRETERGRSNLEFDYRIVAHPRDARYERLPTTK